MVVEPVSDPVLAVRRPQIYYFLIPATTNRNRSLRRLPSQLMVRGIKQPDKTKLLEEAAQLRAALAIYRELVARTDREDVA